VSAVAQRADPVGAYNFVVRLVEAGSLAAARPAAVAPDAQGGFSECSGLGGGVDVEEYREGGRNDTVVRFPTRATWDRIRLRRGVVSDELWNWYLEFVQGRGARRDGLIVLRNDRREPVKVWSFVRGLPVKWTGPALDAAQSRVAVEELEIAHEGIRLLRTA
jgi:phage tail-like protein